MDRYAVVPLSVPSPMGEAYLNSEVTVLPLHDLPTKYEVVRIDPEIWGQMADRFGEGDVVHVPITAQGTTLGVLGFYTNERRAWTLKISHTSKASALPWGSGDRSVRRCSFCPIANA